VEGQRRFDSGSLILSSLVHETQHSRPLLILQKGQASPESGSGQHELLPILTFRYTNCIAGLLKRFCRGKLIARKPLRGILSFPLNIQAAID